MRADHELQAAVLRQLDFDPAINSSQIGVAAREGVVTLTGHVPSLFERTTAERVAGRVRGVKGVVNAIAVELPGTCLTPDEEIAALAYSRLASNTSIPADRIHLAVQDGEVTLHGDVDWNYQRQAAVEDLEKLGCIKAIKSDLEIKPPVEAGQVQRRIHDVLASISVLDAGQIQVSANGTEVTLSGEVTSWHEKELAENTAWCVPGVSIVRNEIVVV
ncbi:MAG TPA: BON domain-containing protein [Devosia sp.]